MKHEMLKSVVTVYMDNGGTLNMLSIELPEKLIDKIVSNIKKDVVVVVYKWTPDRVGPQQALPSNMEFHINMQNVYAADIGEASIPTPSQIVQATDDPAAEARRLGIR